METGPTFAMARRVNVMHQRLISKSKDGFKIATTHDSSLFDLMPDVGPARHLDQNSKTVSQSRDARPGWSHDRGGIDII